MIQEIVENGIKIYSFPDTEGDEEEAAANKKLRVSVHCVMSVANEWLGSDLTDMIMCSCVRDLLCAL